MEDVLRIGAVILNFLKTKSCENLCIHVFLTKMKTLLQKDSVDLNIYRIALRYWHETDIGEAYMCAQSNLRLFCN